VFGGTLDANCFSSFAQGVKTVETVGLIPRPDSPPLKRGVNENKMKGMKL
jgi:hypothetical protein